MTTRRDPDRVLRAWLDLMPSESPDRVIDAVLQTVETEPQVRRPVLGLPFRRAQPVNRLSLAVAAVAVVAILAGGTYLLTSNRGPGVGQIPSPSPTGSPVPPASPSFTPALSPESMRGTWVAVNGPAPSAGGPAPMLRLVIESNRIRILDGGRATLVSPVVAGAFDEFAVVSATSISECNEGNLGRYRYAFGSDGTTLGTEGTLLGLTVVSDDCDARRSALKRTWVHAIDADNAGGRGVATQFSPMFMVTLPVQTYTAGSGPDGLTLDASDGRAFVATRNPWGWTQPCSENGGSKLELAPTIDAFSAYLATLPGFTVQRSEVAIDGRPAVHLVVPTAKTPDCQKGGPNNGHVMEWTTGDAGSPGGWFIRQGDTDSIYLVEVNGSLFLLQWLAPTIDEAAELEVLSTVHFIDALPGQP
jgi:hypothetical protein